MAVRLPPTYLVGKPNIRRLFVGFWTLLGHILVEEDESINRSAGMPSEKGRI